MALVIDITDGRGLSNEARCELLLKKSKIMAFLFTENSRLTKIEVWPIVLRWEFRLETTLYCF